MNILVFDLDYTLTNHNGKVPRSTYHMLKQFKRNKFIMTIITYNPVPQLTPNFTDLYKYFVDKFPDAILTGVSNKDKIDD